jgi:hypothetical protein
MDRPAHILNLPRELRDRIYAHLHHQIDLNWDRDNIIAPRGREGDVQLIEPVPIRLQRCPLPHVFRIHPRIKEEYQDTYVNTLTALIDPSFHILGPAHFRANRDSSARSRAVLARLRHVSLFIKLHARSTSSSLDWADQMDLFRAITSKAPQLLTLRVAVRQQCHLPTGPTVNDKDLEQVLIPAAVRRHAACELEFLPQMPHAFGTLQMVQRGEGYHVGHGGTYQLMPQHTHPQPATTILPGRYYIVNHGIRKIGAYTYSRDPESCTRRLWTEQEIIARWAMRKYQQGIRGIVSDERADWLMKLPFEMTEWAEKRGVEDVKNWLCTP